MSRIFTPLTLSPAGRSGAVAAFLSECSIIAGAKKFRIVTGSALVNL